MPQVGWDPGSGVSARVHMELSNLLEHDAFGADYEREAGTPDAAQAPLFHPPLIHKALEPALIHHFLPITGFPQRIRDRDSHWKLGHRRSADDEAQCGQLGKRSRKRRPK